MGMAAGLRVLLALLLAVRAAALPPAFTSSRFYSAGKVHALPEAPVLDCSNETEVLRVGSLAYPFDAEERELIVFQFTAKESQWLSFALNMVAQLAAAGYHHFVALAGRVEDCGKLHEAWRSLQAMPGMDERLTSFTPACVWASHPRFTDGNSLWVARYALLTRLVEQKVNVLLLDADFVVHRDFYADLYSPCLAPATVLVHAEGGGPNGGFFYVHGAHPDGAAHWVLAQVQRRYDMFVEARNETGRWPGQVMDQEIIKDAVRVASYPTEGSEWDMGSCLLGRRKCDHPFWLKHPQNESVPGEAFTDIDLPDLPCDGGTRWNMSTFRRRGVQEYFGLNRKPAQMSVLYKPRDAPGLKHSELPVEHLMWAPPFFIQYGNIASSAWSSSADPPSALTHMLKAKGLWMSSLKRAAEEGSHVARQSMMLAHGHWLPQLSEKLAEGKRLLFLADHVVALAALHESHKRLRDVVARGLAAAALTGRIFVMPSIPCDAPWIHHGGGEGKTHSLHGVQDPRIVITGTEEAPVCHVGVHPNSQCWPWKFVAYSYDPIVQRRLPGAKAYTMFEQDAISADAADVVLGITPHELQEQGGDSQTRSESVQAECKAFFSEEGLNDPDPPFVE